MTGFNHGITGAVIALSIKQPWLAIPLSYLSHYAVDAIPHFGFRLQEVLGRKFNLFHSSDFIFSLLMMVIIGAIFPSQVLLVWTCMISAAIPDLAWWFNRKTVKQWPKGLGKFTMIHWNVSWHIHHFYFDIVWFSLMWTIVIWIKIG